MIVAIVAIGCGTGIACSFLNTIKAALTRRAGREQKVVLDELQALREEMRQLRQQNNDVILALDTTMHRVEQRLLAPGFPGRPEVPVKSEAAEQLARQER